MKNSSSELDLPGFRFHPTDEELLSFYLRYRVHGNKLEVAIIGTLNIYRHDPWDLPNLSKIGEREWYFFVPRDRRQTKGGRPNRTTERGFWKATGSDRPIRSIVDSKRLIGVKKTLVFYTGRAPRGTKTDWVMNEYRLPDTTSDDPKKDLVLCKVYRKATSLKELEQRASMRLETKASARPITSSMQDTASYSEQGPMPLYDLGSTTMEEVVPKEVEDEACTSSLIRSTCLPELQVPKCNLEWTQDTILSQVHSPWLDQWLPYANILNF